MIETLGKNVKAASKILAQLSTADKNAFLLKLSSALTENSTRILAENAKDVMKASEHGISSVMVDRLKLDEERIAAMSQGLKQVASLPDPINQVIDGFTNLDGLKIMQKRVPLGAVGMIFESRPNVTIEAFALCFKTGNSVLLRGGSDAIFSNTVLVKIIQETLSQANLPVSSVELVTDTSHAEAEKMMQATDYLDVLIPRGSARLINTVKEKAKVPVIETGVGNCSIFVDESADFDMAISIIINAKTQRPSVCNAAESLVIHEKIYAEFLPKLEKAINQVHKITFHADEKALSALTEAVAATDEDFAKEYLDFDLSVKVVSDIDEAIDHINRYASKHSEAIITENYANAEQFQDQIDAAAVYVNASTRFTDGFVFGLGAEIGISTQKLHARGPMGLTALTSTKFVINGQGQIRR